MKANELQVGRVYTVASQVSKQTREVRVVDATVTHWSLNYETGKFFALGKKHAGLAGFSSPTMRGVLVEDAATGGQNIVPATLLS